MFLSHLSNLGFVVAVTDVTGYSHFPLQKRRNIAQQVVDMYSTDIGPTETLTTDNSIRTLLDCMGQSLSLPIEDSGIMKSIIQLYQTWLLGRNRLPALNTTYEEEIVKQISAVFELRSESSNANTTTTGANANVTVAPNAPLSASASSMGGNLADMHAEVCAHALQTLVEYCRAGKFNAFWTLAVKVALGIADYILSDERDPTVNYLGNRLSARVLSAFFEILFTSGTRDAEVWEALPRLVQRWKHRAPLISQWSHISWALTSKLIRYLYGPTCGSDSFSLEDGEAKMVSIVLDEEFTFFCWHKIFFLLGDFENIPDQNNYLLALRGIGRIVDLFLHVGGSKNGSTMLVDGNSILYITGQHLFKAITMFKEYKFDIGKAEAFQILMKIFEEKRGCTFSNNFLAYFYYGLQQALVKNKYLMGTTLHCTKSLFQLELPGSHMLIPDYVQSIQYVLTYKQKTMEGLSGSVHDLKMTCMRILSYFCSMPSHLYRTQQQLTESGSNTAAGHLSKELPASDELVALISQVVVDTLRSHDNQDLLIYCLWLGFVFALEALDLPQCASFPSQFANLVINRIVSATSGWEISAITSGLKILSHFAEYQNTPALCQGDLGSVVVINLCQLVEIHCTTENRKDYSDEVVVNALDAILAWLMNDTQSLIPKDAKISVWQKVFDALNIAAYSKQSLEGSERSPKFVYPSPKVKETAECVMEQLLSKNGSQGASVAFQETDYLERENLSIKNASLFVAGNTIISLITHPRNEVTNSIKIAAFIRSVTGKFFWEGEVHTSAYDTIFGYSNSHKVLSQLSPQTATPVTPGNGNPPAQTKLIDEKASTVSTRLKNCFTSTAQQALYASLLEVAQKQEAKRVENGLPVNKIHAQVQKPQRNSPQHPPLVYHPHRQQFHEHAPQPAPQLAVHPQAQLAQAPTQPLKLVAHPSSPPKSQPLTGPPKISPLNLDSATPVPSIGSPTSLPQQDLTAVRIFLSNLGLISQPPPISMSASSSPPARPRNISHNTPSSPTSSASGAASPAASTSAMLPPAPHNMPAWSHSHANFRVIELANASTFDFLFGLLDELRERECYEISVLYVPPTFSHANSDILFEIPEGSTKFEDFVQALGWKVRLAEHTGYAGQVGFGITPESAENSIYYANNSVELMYRVSTYLTRYRRVALSLAPPTPRLEPESNAESAKTNAEAVTAPADKPRPKKGPPPMLSSPPRFAQDQAKMDPRKDKRASFKKSMSVSGGMGFNTIPSRDMMSSTNVRNAAQNVFRKTSFGDEESNIHTLASRKKLLTHIKVLILWMDGSRAAAHLSPNPRPATTPNANNLLQLIGSRALVSIIIFPLKSGLFHIRVIKKPTVLLGPLLDDIVVSFQQLPHLVRFTAINAHRALTDPDSPRPSVVRKNVIEDFAKPSKDHNFYNFYSPHFPVSKDNVPK